MENKTFRKQLFSIGERSPLTIHQIEEREEKEQKPEHEQILVAVIGGHPVMAFV